jgi:hypothetical protein
MIMFPDKPLDEIPALAGIIIFLAVLGLEHRASTLSHSITPFL